jgi:cytoskeletal protein CcmA (bactofilin family)
LDFSVTVLVYSYLRLYYSFPIDEDGCRPAQRASNSGEDFMWNKTPEVKPSSQSYNQPAPAPPASPAAPVASAPARESAATPAGASTSKISSGLKISGEFSGNSDLYIDGEVLGKIRLGNARVTVGPNGKVQADIEAREIFVDGTVQGNLKAGERAHFGASSRVTGSVLTPRIGIDDGARLRGKVETVRANPVRESALPAKERDSEALQPVAASVKSE